MPQIFLGQHHLNLEDDWRFSENQLHRKEDKVCDVLYKRYETWIHTDTKVSWSGSLATSAVADSTAEAPFI